MTDLTALLPHRAPMLLLAGCQAVDNTHARSLVCIQSGSLFADALNNVPAWLLIEQFAQTAALIGGWQAQAQRLNAPQGYLLGTRRFECNVPHLPAGRELCLEARLEMADSGGMQAFSCHTVDDTIKAACVLSVYIPPDNVNSEALRG